MTAKKKSYTKIALALSIGLLILWAVLGATTSLAWFTDTTPVQKNIFDIGELDLVVSYRQEDGSYKEVDSTTAVFDDEALYEPGYVQVVYLRIENKGEIPFDYRTAITVNNYTTATNWYGHPFNLPDYLRFGVVSADEEDELMELVETRLLANGKATRELASIANRPLNKYSTEVDSLEVDDEDYIALIVRMPEEVSNVANYRGDVVPKVEMGVIVSASQQGTPVE